MNIFKLDLSSIFIISNNYTDITISDILNISYTCITRGYITIL